MTKDWTGNYNSIFKTLGASNHTDKERQNEDYYATDPIAIDALKLSFTVPQNIWECASGGGHLARRLQELGHNVYCTDIIDRGCCDDIVDFLSVKTLPSGIECILTNPPYAKATEFVLHSLDLLNERQYCIMFLKTTFLEGKKRYEQIFSKQPPKYVFQFVNRIMCAKNGDFETMIKGGGSAVAYAWYVWEKGYKGETIIKWLNNNKIC